MDEAFARALKMGNDAIRSVDPQAYVGIGGGQMPGWGGYDYSRITTSLTPSSHTTSATTSRSFVP